ncbi:MAG TPA: protease inhibitor I42 family protein [Longimicrobium sp.]|nr:protease inhibitor I42 family protein [Longimicrobium sp.]
MRPLPRLLLAAVALSAACAKADTGELGHSDPRRPIVAAAGTEFQLVLKSNPSTGYAWILADSLPPGVLALVGSRYEPDRRSAGRDGGGGRERWTFRALGPGEAAIPLVYARPWERNDPADSARFQVTVR